MRMPVKPMRYCTRLLPCGMMALLQQENKSEVLSWRI